MWAYRRPQKHNLPSPSVGR